jgi:uncharacterized membrane protein YgcG
MGRLLSRVLLCLLLLPALAGAQESIQDFNVTLQVLRDGSLLVTERIRVKAEGQQIQRGIYRDVPHSYLEDHGLLHRSPVTLLGATRDGQFEPVRVERNGAWQRFYLGSSNLVLSPGEYSYELRYQVERALLFHPDTDELYWNVTGNQWSLPIAKASVEVLLPPRIGLSKLHAYTGSSGASGQDYAVLEQQEPRVVLQTTKALGSYQGFTVALEWPAGLIARPAFSQRLLHGLGDNLGLLLGVLTLLGVGLFYHLVWRKVGRDPAKGLVVPLFQAPEGVTPAMAGYLWSRGFARHFSMGKALSIWLTQLAISKHLSIAQEDPAEGFTLTRGSAPLSQLPEHGQRMCNALFPDGAGQESVVIGKEHEPRLEVVRDRLNSYLQVHSAKWYRANRGWWLLGLLVAVLGGVLMLLTTDVLDMTSSLGGLVFAGVFLVPVAILLKLAWQAPKKIMRWLLGLLALLFSWPVWRGLYELASSTPWPFTVVLLGLSALVLVYYILLPAPSPEGRALLDQLEGYRDYLRLGEAEVLAMAGQAPAMTIAHYELHLPYAMALGVEQQWTQRFSAMLDRGLNDARDYRPAWYHSGGLSVSPLDLSRALAVGLAGVAALASSPPSSSGGGGAGGGGSSGGGRGGGGGGGW